MKRPESRHYSEEELLMHLLEEETSGTAREISTHLMDCGECDAILKDYGQVVRLIHEWDVPDLSEETWRLQKAAVLARYRQDYTKGRSRGIISAFARSLQLGWSYALEHPLPTLGFVAAAVTFAMEQTISTFRLDQILPGASDVFRILKQIL